jgi:lipopolysaccharide export system ATP-binding protein
MYKRAQLGIGYLPQEASVFRKLSVEDNIKAILEMTDKSKEEQPTSWSAAREFSLQHVRKNMGDVLSGGERRRTEIARAWPRSRSSSCSMSPSPVWTPSRWRTSRAS